MNVNSMFPSKWVAASDLCGQDVVVVIASVGIEKVGADEEQRPVLHFQGMTKGMVLNRTNAKRISAMYGQDTDNWIGKPIALYESETEYGGETVPCIRVRKESPIAPIAVNPVAQQPVAGNGGVRF